MDLKEQDELGKVWKALGEVKDALSARPNDGIKKDELEKIVSVMVDGVVKKQADASAVPTVEFGDGKKTFMEWMKMVHTGDQRVKTVVSVNETTSADGGIVVPTAFVPKILETAINSSIVAPLASEIPMNTWKATVPNQATDVSVAWVAENGTVTIQVPTLGSVSLALGKLSAVIPFSTEILMDAQVDLSAFYQMRVGKKMGQTMDAKILEGRVAVSGDLADGIKYATGVNEKTFVKAITADDIIDLQCAQEVEDYHTNAQWFMNRKALAILMKLRDNNGQPLFGSLVNGVPTSLLGKGFKLTDQISGAGTSASKTSIYYGDMSNAWVLKHSKFPGMTVRESNSAVAPAVGTPTQNAFLNGQIWYRYDLRRGYVIAVPAAFVRGLDVFK